jgi:hypothetical protein
MTDHSPMLSADEYPNGKCLPRGSAVIDRLMFRTALLESGCWEWRGARNPKGYGNIRVDKISPAKSAHRVAYIELVGPIPQHLEVDHLCRNRACINPVHLELVDHATNVRRGVQPRFPSCKSGHEFTEENTRWWGPDKRFRACRACAREFTRQHRSRKKTQA